MMDTGEVCIDNLIVTFDSCHILRWGFVRSLVEREYYNFDSGEK